MHAAFASPNPRHSITNIVLNRTDGKRHYIKGFCCTACAAGLLKKLAAREAEEWAQEEAELQADDMDVTDLQKREVGHVWRSIGTLGAAVSSFLRSGRKSIQGLQRQNRWILGGGGLGVSANSPSQPAHPCAVTDRVTESSSLAGLCPLPDRSGRGESMPSSSPRSF